MRNLLLIILGFTAGSCSRPVGVTITPEAFERGGDWTKAMQSALDAAARDGGGTVTLRPRTYRITETLHCSASNVRVVGSGKASIILLDGDFGDGFHFAPPAEPLPKSLEDGLTGIEFRDFAVLSTVRRTRGAAIHVKASDDTFIERVQIDKKADRGQKMYDGIVLESQSECHIAGCQVSTTHYGAFITGNKLLGEMPFYGYNGRITDCEFWGTEDWVSGSAAVVLAGGCGGFEVGGNSNLSHYETGLWITGKNREIFIRGCYFDGLRDCGLKCDAGGALTLIISEGWAAACGIFGPTPNGEGVRILGVTDIYINGGNFYMNHGPSIDIQGYGSVTITGTRSDNTHIGAGISDVSILGGCIPGPLLIDAAVKKKRVVGVTGQSDQ